MSNTPATASPNDAPLGNDAQVEAAPPSCASRVTYDQNGQQSFIIDPALGAWQVSVEQRLSDISARLNSLSASNVICSSGFTVDQLLVSVSSQLNQITATLAAKGLL